jgi:hypothetical protein
MLKKITVLRERVDKPVRPDHITLYDSVTVGISTSQDLFGAERIQLVG